MHTSGRASPQRGRREPSPYLGHTRNIDLVRDAQRKREVQIHRLAVEHQARKSSARQFDAEARDRQREVEEAAARAAKAANRAAKAQEEEECAVEAARQAELERLEARRAAAAEENAARLAKKEARRLSDAARSRREANIAELRERTEHETAIAFHCMTAPRNRLEGSLHQQTVVGGPRAAAVTAAEHERAAAREWRRSEATWKRYAAQFEEGEPLPGQTGYDHTAQHWHEVGIDEGLQLLHTVQTRQAGWHEESSMEGAPEEGLGTQGSCSPLHVAHTRSSFGTSAPSTWPGDDGTYSGAPHTARYSHGARDVDHADQASSWASCYPYEQAIRHGVDPQTGYPFDYHDVEFQHEAHYEQVHQVGGRGSSTWDDVALREREDRDALAVVPIDAWQDRLESAEARVWDAMAELATVRTRMAAMPAF